MKAVKIAALKSHLSQHLRDVRSGHVITVMDRTIPIARLVPFDSGDDVTITPPMAGMPSVGKIKLPPASKVEVDVVKVLLADRRSRL